MSESYTPYGGASDLWKCRKREVLFDGPAGTGKTRALVEKAHLAAMKYPGARILFVRRSRSSQTESVLITYETKTVVPDGWGILQGSKRQFRQAYTYPTSPPSVIVVGGLDNVDRIMSTEYDLICLFEATEATLNDWEMLLTRLRNGVMPYQQAIADCNPSYPKHWLKVRADKGDMHRIMSRHEDNPTVTEEYLEALDKLTGYRRNRLRYGQWVAAEGIIYEAWDEKTYVQSRSGPWKRTVIGVDDGYTNPCSIHVYHVDNDGRVHVAEEYYLTNQLETDTLNRVNQLVSKYEAEAVIIDPSAAKLIARCENEGLPIRQANNDVFGGIRICQERLQIPDDGIPRLTVDPKCKNWINEIEAYAWMENKHGDLQDKPKKENDHAMDDWRYSMMYLDEGNLDMRAFLL